MQIDYSIQYAKWHDDSPEHYAETAQFYGDLLAPILRDIDKSARVLDIGCGTGLLVNALRGFGYANVEGIDLSPQQIEVARAAGLPCTLVDEQYVERRAGTEPGSLDAVFLMDVLEHVPVASQMAFVGAIGRLLKPDGVLVISVPNANSSFASRWRYIDWTHCSAFTEHSLEFVVKNQGFRQVAYFPYEYGQRPRFPYVHHPSFWTWLVRRLVRSFRRLEAIGEFGRQGLHMSLSLNLLAVCRKTE
jgi:2-polyprenyl-3-methyl-5-hydroxy-6-metoxy-1,4-benzoquinol methylase